MRKGFGLVGLLFVLTCLLAGLLGLLLLLAPWLDSGDDNPAGWPEAVLALFARDAVVRRIGLAGAIGLGVSAFVFFRPGSPAAGSNRSKRGTAARKERSRASGSPDSDSAPPRSMAGA